MGLSPTDLLWDFSGRRGEWERLWSRDLSDTKNGRLADSGVNWKNAICRVLSACDQPNPLVPVVAGLRTKDTVPEPETVQRKARSLQAAIKEVAGIHVLLVHSLFGDDIPRKLLLRVSAAKPPSAPLRF
jgi:hypothetical protein